MISASDIWSTSGLMWEPGKIFSHQDSSLGSLWVAWVTVLFSDAFVTVTISGKLVFCIKSCK